MKKKRLYIHLLDNQPVRFSGEQICFAGHISFPVKPVKDLKTIKKEQKMSAKWRKGKGFGEGAKPSYAYIELS